MTGTTLSRRQFSVGGVVDPVPQELSWGEAREHVSRKADALQRRITAFSAVIAERLRQAEQAAAARP